MGLLKRLDASQTKTNSQFSFQTWAKKNGLAHCALFCKTGKKMLARRAFGVDARSILNFVFDEDFWEENGKDCEWIFAERQNAEFANFAQFLGRQAKEKAEHVAVLKIRFEKPISIEENFFEADFEKSKIAEQNSPLALFCYDEKKIENLPKAEECKIALEKILQNQKSALFEIPTIEKISGLVGFRGATCCTINFENARPIKAQSDAMLSILLNTIFEELFFETKNIFSWPDFVYSSERGKIKIAAVISQMKSDEKIKERLVASYKEILGMTSAQKILVQNVSQVFGEQKILSYLLEG